MVKDSRNNIWNSKLITAIQRTVENKYQERKKELPCTQQTKCFMDSGIKHNLPVPNIINPVKGNRELQNSEFLVRATIDGEKWIYEQKLH